MIRTIPTPSPSRDSRGAIATARISGQFTTPEDGFVVDLEELDRLTDELVRREMQERQRRPEHDDAE